MEKTKRIYIRTAIASVLVMVLWASIFAMPVAAISPPSLLHQATLKSGDYGAGAAIPPTTGIVNTPEGVEYISTEPDNRSNALINWVIPIPDRLPLRVQGTITFMFKADRQTHVSGEICGDNNGDPGGMSAFATYANRIANGPGIQDDQVAIKWATTDGNTWWWRDEVILEYDRWYQIGLAWGGPQSLHETWVCGTLGAADSRGVLPWGVNWGTGSATNFGLGDNHLRHFDPFGSAAGVTFADISIWSSYQPQGGTSGPCATQDFGDAPDPLYPTLLASNGARHQVSGLFMGAAVDCELDGQPTANADGDDLLDGNDDEDGVTFTSPLQPGVLATVDVHGGPSGGLLDGWVDFNGNGNWLDAGEQVFWSLPIAPGPNPALPVPVPAGAAVGPTYARFRLSTIGQLSPDGLAPDGEVEDYMVTIGPLGKIIIGKQTDPDGSAHNFTFTGDANGSIQDDETIEVSGLPAGEYTSTEIVSAGWSLTSIVCDDSNSSGNLSTRTATFKLEAGETVKAVFYNTELPPTPPSDVEVGGDVSPVNRLTLLAPWIALAAIIVAGATVTIRRRLTQN